MSSATCGYKQQTRLGLYSGGSGLPGQISGFAFFLATQYGRHYFQGSRRSFSPSTTALSSTSIYYTALAS
eukprot:8612983-Pyramimonas_sp.AAC.1